MPDHYMPVYRQMVLNGHTAAVFVKFKKNPNKKEC